MIPTYPSVAVCRTLPAVVGNSAVCLNDFLWQRRRNLVGVSQGQPQFKALNWMPQRHPCCHVQEDNAIFEHLCQPGLFCETSQDEFSDRFQLPRTMGLVEATQGFHAVDQRPMCCDKVCLCVHVQCNCLHSSKARYWYQPCALDQACNPIFETQTARKKTCRNQLSWSGKRRRLKGFHS